MVEFDTAFRSNPTATLTASQSAIDRHSTVRMHVLLSTATPQVRCHQSPALRSPRDCRYEVLRIACSQIVANHVCLIKEADIQRVSYSLRSVVPHRYLLYSTRHSYIHCLTLTDQARPSFAGALFGERQIPHLRRVQAGSFHLPPIRFESKSQIHTDAADGGRDGALNRLPSLRRRASNRPWDRSSSHRRTTTRSSISTSTSRTSTAKRCAETRTRPPRG